MKRKRGADENVRASFCVSKPQMQLQKKMVQFISSLCVPLLGVYTTLIP